MVENEISSAKNFPDMVDPDIGETTETSWSPPAEMTYEKWERVGFPPQTVHRSMRWWLGAWLNSGETKYGETYTQAIIATDTALETLKKYKSTAERISAQDRIADLSWTHHFYVAYLPKEEHHTLLRIAYHMELTSRQFRAVVELPPDERSQLIELFEQFDAPGEYAHTLAALRTLEEHGSIYLPEDVDDYEEEEEEEPEKSTDSVEHEVMIDGDEYRYKTDSGSSVVDFWSGKGVPIVHADAQTAEWKGIRVVAVLDEDGQPLLLWDMVGVE